MEATHKYNCLDWLKNIFTVHYEGMIIFWAPILFLPILLSDNDPANKCMYVLAVMAVYWITEVIPLGITSLLPTLAYPAFQIMSTDKACGLFFRDVAVMFVSSMMVAGAIERSKLHSRLALKVIQLIGCSPRRLHFGMCMATTFLSMWIANAAATAMMCPVLFAVLRELDMQGLIKQFHDDDMELPIKERRPSDIASCFYLSIAYSSTIGGIATLIGTPTNLAVKGIYDSRFPDSTETILFGTYMVYAAPMALVGIIFTFITMEMYFMGLFRPNSAASIALNVGKSGEEHTKKVIDQKYEELGPISVPEITTALLFTTLILLFVFRKPGFVEGWSIFFDQEGIRNSVPTIAILVLLFALPGNYNFLRLGNENSYATTPTLLTWDFVKEKVPWGLVFVVGGGPVIAEGSKVSGMAVKLGKALSVVDILPPTLVLLSLVTVATVLTNFSANVAVCNITIPVLVEMAVAMEVHPLYLVLPVGLGCNFAFMTPVGTPANAIVQGYFNIPSSVMMKGGFLPSVANILVVWLMAQSYGLLVYPNMVSFPAWAKNDTARIAIGRLFEL